MQARTTKELLKRWAELRPTTVPKIDLVQSFGVSYLGYTENVRKAIVAGLLLQEVQQAIMQAIMEDCFGWRGGCNHESGYWADILTSSNPEGGYWLAEGYPDIATALLAAWVGYLEHNPDKC